MKKNYELTEMEKDALREIGFIGVGHASQALSKMIGKRIDVDVPLAQTVSLEKIPQLIGGPETMVTSLYLPITGDINGSVLIIFPKKSALTLVDMIQNRESGFSKALDEMDKSTLKEVGNILSGNCLTALSGFLGMSLIEHIPDITSDMVSAVIDFVIVKFGQKTEQALVLEMEFKTAEKTITGFFFLLFTIEEAKTIFQAIRKKVEM